jgi:hypothetical protein
MAKARVLTEALILKKSKSSSLSDVRNLTLWGMHLADVSIVSRLENVETVALSVNEVDSLEPFSPCTKLRELFLRKNHIAELCDLDHLRGLTELRVLWLTDNPITEKPGYREYTIVHLPQLTKLDEVDITADEREAANQKFFPQPPAAAPPPVPPPTREGQVNILAAIRLLLQKLMHSMCFGRRSSS